MTRFTRIARAHKAAPLVCALVVAGVSAGLLMAIPSAARADYTNCGSSNFCIWHDSEYSGGFCVFNERGDGSNKWVGGQTNACWDGSSMYNNRMYKSRYSADPDLSKEIACIKPRDRIANLANGWKYKDGLNQNDNTYFVYLNDPGTTC